MLHCLLYASFFKKKHRKQFINNNYCTYKYNLIKTQPCTKSYNKVSII